MNRLKNGDSSVTTQPETRSSGGLGGSATDTKSGVLQSRLLSYEAASHYLSLSYWSVRDLVLKGEVPHIKFGKRILIDRDDLDEWIESRKEIGV